MEGHNKATLSDLLGHHDVECEVNWASAHKDCVKIKMGKHEAVVKIADLYAFTFSVANTEQQSSLLPVRQTQVMKYMRQHRVVANKDIKRGEKIVVNCEMDVPLTIVESLRGDVFKQKSSIIG